MATASSATNALRAEHIRRLEPRLLRRRPTLEDPPLKRRPEVSDSAASMLPSVGEPPWYAQLAELAEASEARETAPSPKSTQAHGTDAGGVAKRLSRGGAYCSPHLLVSVAVKEWREHHALQSDSSHGWARSPRRAAGGSRHGRESPRVAMPAAGCTVTPLLVSSRRAVGGATPSHASRPPGLAANMNAPNSSRWAYLLEKEQLSGPAESADAALESSWYERSETYSLHPRSATWASPFVKIHSRPSSPLASPRTGGDHGAAPHEFGSDGEYRTGGGDGEGHPRHLAVTSYTPAPPSFALGIEVPTVSHAAYLQPPRSARVSCRGTHRGAGVLAPLSTLPRPRTTPGRPARTLAVREDHARRAQSAPAPENMGPQAAAKVAQTATIEQLPVPVPASAATGKPPMSMGQPELA
jgi:hypothetical protein